LSQGMFNMFYHSHAGSWFLTILFFLLSYFFMSKGKLTVSKVIHMILRLFSLIMIATGVGMLIGLHFPLTYVVKGLLALILIGLMEMILVRSRKGKAVKPLWITFVIVLILVLLLGFKVISL
jgi:hypothetical protein